MPRLCRTARPFLGVGPVIALILVLGPIVPSLVPPLGTSADRPSSSLPNATDGSSVSAGLTGENAYTTPFADRAGYSAGEAGAAVDVAPAVGSVLVVVTFVPRNLSEFSAPVPPDGRPLSVAQVADRFGISREEYSEFEQYFLAHGVTILHSWPDRLSMTVTGTASAVGSAFGTVLLSGSEAGTLVTFPGTAPVLPDGLEPLVGSVVGLSSGFDKYTIPSTPSSADVTGGPAIQGPNEVTPAIARQIYGLSNLYNVSGTFHSASSEGIALLLWGRGYSPADLQTFFQKDYPAAFPSPTIDPYPIDGAPSPSASAVNDPCGDAKELTLDIEWAGSMAPGATLYPVYAPETAAPGCSPTDATIADALNQAVDLPVAAISMSFGTAESTSGGLAAAWQTDIGVAVQRGISLVAATGDFGGDVDANCQGGPSPEYPSTSPDVLAVGGTEVTLSYGILGGVNGFTETAWSDSGGGYSEYPPPVWQPSDFPGRGVPDVAATAEDNYLYYSGQNAQGGGTSFATPLWAGLVTEMDAIHGSPFGLIAPRLYAVGNEEVAASDRTPTGLAAITSGSNCVATAGPEAGWNAVTGWGTPRALNLYEDLTATFVNLSVVASPSTVAQGASVTIAGHLANATDGAPISGVPVAVSLTSSVDIGPCVGVFGSITATTGADGNVSVSMHVPGCYFGSHAVAQLLVTSDGFYGTNSTTIAVNLLGLVPGLGVLEQFPYNVATFILILGVASAAGYVLGRRKVLPASPPGPPTGPPDATISAPTGPGPPSSEASRAEETQSR